MRRSIPFLFAFIALTVHACSPAFALWGKVPMPTMQGGVPTSLQLQTPSLPPTPTETLLPTPTLTPTPEFTSTPTATRIPGKADRVVIFTFDGLRADAIEQAPMVYLTEWMNKGMYTLDARTVSPSLTLPAHASIVSGLCVWDHGITWNSTFLAWGYSQGVDIFDLAHAAGMQTVLITGKDKLRQLAEPETTDVFEVHPADSAIMEAALAQIPAGFDLMLVHFPSADDRGHKYGWMSNAQFKALRESDTLFGRFMSELEIQGLLDTTLVIVTADHGGSGENHDGDQLADQVVPWAAFGAGVKPGQIQRFISITDTAATAAQALELPLQPEWAGIPVYEVFGLPVLKTHDKNPCKD